MDQEKLKNSNLTDKVKDLLEDNKLNSEQHRAIEKTLNEKIAYLNDKISNFNIKIEEIQGTALKEMQEKNILVASLMRKLEVKYNTFIFV